MHRRNFIRNTAFSAVAVSAFGFVRFDGDHYVGDCETTSDILGPFYRPGSPVRNSLVIKGEPGELVELTGMIKHKDCVTPYKNAKIELWHCDSKGVYDNETADYRYRGTSYCDDKGHYSFQTIMPVAYDVGSGFVRPAHFHLMITAEGYQPLVTQLYFTGDKYIPKDSSASSPLAKKRILNVQTKADGTKQVLYDVSMAEQLAVNPADIDKLTGVYTEITDKTKTVEFAKQDNFLLMKNEVFGMYFVYTGDNSFEYPGMPPGAFLKLNFVLLGSGDVKLNFSYNGDDMVEHSEVYMKTK